VLLEGDPAQTYVYDEYIFFNAQRIARRSQFSQTNSSLYYFFSDHLGSSRIVTDSTGAVKEDSDFYPFGGERVVLDGLNNNYKFTGKERDPESGLDNFVARYNSSNIGRFMSPDPLGGRIVDPQTLNKYSYVRNNPLNLIDPTGMYICEGTAKQCDNFEKSRQENLDSKDDDVVRGAKAYGDPGNDNGVTVKFGDPGKGRDGNTSHDLRVDPNDPSKFQAVETVTIRSGLSGTALEAAVAHEGSHVADAQDFVATANMTTGEYDASKNLASYQTEFKAFMVTQSVLAAGNTRLSYGQCGGGEPCMLGAGVTPAKAVETINRLLANPANGYGVTPANPGPLLYPTLTTPK
jgi:RHS repeat-associated protein